MTKLTPTDESTMGTVTAEVEPEGWQSMKTAPRDGRLVDLWVQQGDLAWREADCSWTPNRGWINARCHTLGLTATNLHILCWQPLPAPPKDEPR